MMRIKRLKKHEKHAALKITGYGNAERLHGIR